MGSRELTRGARNVALEHGADLVGVVGAEDLPEHEEEISKMLPSSKSVMVVASCHSREVIEGAGLLEMWQTFMTGNDYYCFHCQSQCPASALYPRT